MDEIIKTLESIKQLIECRFIFQEEKIQDLQEKIECLSEELKRSQCDPSNEKERNYWDRPFRDHGVEITGRFPIKKDL